jgi:hypothetical protein
LSQSQTLVALALADHADDNGECWPSIDRIATKARLQRRSTQVIIRHLEELGLITVQRGGGRYQTNRYTFHIVKGALNAPLPTEKGAATNQETVQPQTQRVQPQGQNGAAATAPKSSITIKEPPEEPSGLNSQAWEKFKKYRTDIRKPIKQASILAAQQKLAGFGTDQLAVVQQSIESSWTGLFALKNGNGHAPKPGRKTADELEAEALSRGEDIWAMEARH